MSSLNEIAILSTAGKPIFHYGDHRSDENLASLCGLIIGCIANIELNDEADLKPELQKISGSNGGGIFFLNRPPLIYLAISSADNISTSYRAYIE